MTSCAARLWRTRSKADSGADQLWGNKGNDVLIGGVGADTYWFGVGDGSDTITDGGALNAYDVVNLNGNQLQPSSALPARPALRPTRI